MSCLCLQCDLRSRCTSYGDEVPRRVFATVASQADKAPSVDCKPLRRNAYTRGGKSIVAIVRTGDRAKGIEEAVRLLGGVEPALKGADGYVLVKPNWNSHDPFPGSTHPDTLRNVLRMLFDRGYSKDDLVVGDMSGPNWLPTRKTARLNNNLSVAEEFGVKISFFDEEEWVAVKPKAATTWPNGFRLARTVYNASRVISLPCLKTHAFGGVFSLSLKNAVGVINPADRLYLHQSPNMRELIAEANLGYSADLIILDGMRCFVSGGPAVGKVMEPGVIIAGGDRVAVDAVGVSVLKSLSAKNIADVSVKRQEQISRATSLGLGSMDLERIELETNDLVGDERFTEMVGFVRGELR